MDGALIHQVPGTGKAPALTDRFRHASACSLPRRCTGSAAGQLSQMLDGSRVQIPRQTICRAAVADDTEVAGANLLEHNKTFTYGKGEFKLHANVTENANGAQALHLETDYPSASNLILHWGVQGGKNYYGGWRLPDERPPNTIQYKDRALQTSWRQEGGKLVLDIALSPDEAADYLNFVIKDAATNTWFDANGSNFQLALRNSLRSFMSIDDSEFGPVLSLEEIPEIPSELAGIWAYIMWESAGCPQRSQDAADREYREGIAELQQCLCRGKSLDELWQVARGDTPYQQFKADFVDIGRRAEMEARAVIEKMDGQQDGSSSGSESDRDVQHTVEVTEVYVPDDVIGIQAYILWEEAGRPDGADFSQQARDQIHSQLKSGKDLKAIEAALRSPQKRKESPPPPQPSQPAAASQSATKPTEAPPAPKQESAPKPSSAPAPAGGSVEVGAGLDGLPATDPLKLIKNATVPLLSSEKRKRKTGPLEFLVQAAAVDEATRFRRLYKLADGAELLVTVRRDDGAPDAESENGAESGSEGSGPTVVTLTTSSPNDLVLHWGVSKGDKGWLLPPKPLWKQVAGSMADAGGKAIETPFQPRKSEQVPDGEGGEKDTVPLQELQFTVPPDGSVSALQFVLRSGDRSAWYRDGSGNFFVPLMRRKGGAAAAETLDSLLQGIVDAENSDKWTLMHRFNAVAGLLQDSVLGGAAEDMPRAAAAAYVWLRYSATRALTWQRNYNTQPRQLSGAQAHLTDRMAEAHARTSGEAQEWIRLALGTVGRGGDGQAIRDEILHIMHRNHIPEKKGTWMEEWHQKLHNNTTPDDVPICRAYLAFLRANGDNGVYWRVLSDNGISRARLESFDRPIVQEPADFPDRRGQLIRDFEHYLGILKAVHSGADLQASAKAAGHCLPSGAKGHLGYVLASLGSNQILPLVQSAVACRLELHSALPGNKDLLYLDLALEGVVRAAMERGIGSLGMGACAFVGPLLQNLVLTAGDNEEMCYCLKAWQALPRSVQFGATPSTVEALQATAVVDRLRRAVGALSMSVSDRIQPIAAGIGENCGIEEWTIELFSEEVVRGGPAFAVSLVLATVEPALRRHADLGAWQIISPADVVGRVVEVPALHEVQDKRYEEPTILLAKQVSGEEEIPENVVGVVTPDAPDILSHSSVRARNMEVLLVTCHDPEPLDEISGYVGKLLSIQTTAAGNVTWNVADAADVEASSNGNSAKGALRGKLKMEIPEWSGKWAVPMSEYKDGVVGAKSKNLAALRGELPEWIALPSSVTLPFGCFEKALDDRANADVKRRLLESAKLVPDNPAQHLYDCREAVKGMVLPAVLQEELAEQMRQAGIPLPEGRERWAQAEAAIIGVWASKFNDRAYFSMRKVGLDFMDLRMAVLVQRVVPAEYAFVIHTVNPSTGNEDEVYCELVKGLGETLVSGTVPGSALSFTAPKSDLTAPEVRTFLSKSHGMFVPESLIFRSDSNGEDLAGYAGAGLYESITMDPSTLDIVDFSADRIMTNPTFRQELLGRICQVGVATEESMGSPQDIEGVVGPDGSITVVQTRPQV